MEAETLGGLLGSTGSSVQGPEQCLHCGESEQVEVFEVWADGSFMLDTCCEGMREAVSEFLAEDPRRAALWLGRVRDQHGFTLADLCAGRLRRVIADEGQLLLDWNLKVVQLPWATVKGFVLEHHRHCKPPAGWRFGAGVMNGAQLVGVVSVGRPVARLIDATRVVEVNRLCVRRDVPPGLVWNACSLLYGWAARQAQERGFERVITYTLAEEAGTTLRAAGWTPEIVTRGGSWSRPSRERGDGGPTGSKTRWVRELKPHRARARPVQQPPAVPAPARPGPAANEPAIAKAA